MTTIKWWDGWPGYRNKKETESTPGEFALEMFEGSYAWDDTEQQHRDDIDRLEKAFKWLLNLLVESGAVQVEAVKKLIELRRASAELIEEGGAE